MTTTFVPENLRAAAEAAISVLPSSETRAAGEPGSDPAAAGSPGAAVSAPLSGKIAGTLTVLVAQELVDALRGSPLGNLDLAAAVAPALDAAAEVLGSVAGPGTEVPADTALGAAGGQLVVVPLTADGKPHAAIALSLPAPAEADSAHPAAAPARTMSGLDLLHGVEMEVTVELGRTRLTVRDLLSLRAGSVIELDRAAGSPADVLVNGRLIARGEVVVIEENFGIRITEILASSDRTVEAA
jgi:flagellar motor switch protein FliN/FliY